MNWRFWEKPFSNVIPDSHKSKNAVATYQADRKAREAYPTSWLGDPEKGRIGYRQALIDCGLVEERRQMRAGE
jgi:hypothetical protein